MNRPRALWACLHCPRALGRCVGSQLAEQRCSSPPSAPAARCETARVYARYTVNSSADAKAQFTSRLPGRPRRASQRAAETAPQPPRTAKQTTMKKFQPLGGGGPRKGPPTKRLGTCGRPLILSDQERFRRDSCSQGDGNDDMAVVRAPLVPGLLTTAPVSLKVRQKFRPLGVGGRRANELLKKSCLGPRRVAPGKALVSKFLSGRDFTPGEIQVPTDMDLSLMEDLSDAEAMDEEEPPPKYRPSVGVPSFARVLVRPSRRRRETALRPRRRARTSSAVRGRGRHAGRRSTSPIVPVAAAAPARGRVEIERAATSWRLASMA